MNLPQTLRQIFLENKEISIFLAGLTLLRLIYILLIPITPQEAYYWYYSLYPDLSYFDHPPMAAYSIWLGTLCFGNTIFGVKFMAVVWSLMTNIMLYITTRYILSGKTSGDNSRPAFLVVLLYNLTIFSHLYAIVIVPDTPLLFFWILIIYLIFKYLRTESAKYVYLAGISLGLGLMSKYTVIAIVPAIFVIILISPQYRNKLLKPHLYLALLLAFIVFSPILYWNMIHDWASIKFQFADRSAELKSFQTKYFFQLIASQIFLLTPFPLVFFISGIKSILKKWQILETEHNLILTGAFIILGFIAISFRSLVKMNWLLPGYLGLIIATVLVYKDRLFRRTIWIKTGLAFSVLLIIIAHLLLLVPNVPLGEGNTWSGWRSAAQNIATTQKQQGGKENIFIFTNSYKSSSLLRFYMPDDQQVYAQNIYGEPALQFDIWGIPDSLQGKNALFIRTDRYEYGGSMERVESYFAEIELIAEYDSFFMDSVKTRTIYCYLCKNYSGMNPETE